MREACQSVAVDGSDGVARSLSVTVHGSDGVAASLSVTVHGSDGVARSLAATAQALIDMRLIVTNQVISQEANNLMP